MPVFPLSSDGLSIACLLFEHDWHTEYAVSHFFPTDIAEGLSGRESRRPEAEALLLTLGGGGGGLGARLKPGTRAWEASMTLDPLGKCIADRRAELASATDPARKDRLQRELAFLEKQVPELQAIVAANDGSPGRGYIGFDNLPSD